MLPVQYQALRLPSLLLGSIQHLMDEVLLNYGLFLQKLAHAGL